MRLLSGLSREASHLESWIVWWRARTAQELGRDEDADGAGVRGLVLALVALAAASQTSDGCVELTEMALSEPFTSNEPTLYMLAAPS